VTRRLLLTYLTITAFVLIVLEIPLGITDARRELDRLTSDLERDATVFATLVEDTLQAGATTGVSEMAAAYEARTGARVVVTDRSGQSIADTETDAGRDFSNRPEIADALAGGRATGVRRSETLDTNLLYVAVPVASGGNVYGSVRLTYPTSEVDTHVAHNWIRLLLLAVVVLGASAVVGTLLARSVTRPLHQLERTADTIAHGRLEARAEVDSGPPEVRHLARTFNTMAGQLEDLVSSQRQFTANVSHDLRTPLTALRLRLDNLEDEIGSAEARADLEAALAETARLDRMVERLLAFARAGREKPEPEVVDLAAAARERHDIWEPLAEERGVTLQVEAPGSLPARSVAGAPEQILDNLIANALDVSPAGTAITLQATPRDEWAELHVVDEGPGLAPEQRERAFERFWRASEDAGGNGSGLGLAIVLQLARAGGGDARLDEAPTGGIDACVRFPSASR